MSFWSWIQSNTQGITEFVRQTLFMLLGFDLLVNAKGEPWTDAQTGLVLAVISALMAMITAKTNVSTMRVDKLKAEAKAEGFAQGSGTGDGTSPPRL